MHKFEGVPFISWIFAVMSLYCTASASALPVSEIQKLDIDGDGFIEQGPEMRALRALFPRLNGQQSTRLGKALDNKEPKIAVSEFDTSSFYEELRTSCRVGKPFRLAESLASVSLLHPDIVVPSDLGAKFAFDRDEIAKRSSWEVAGTAIYVPNSANRCLHVGSPNKLEGGELTGYVIAPYLSFNGSGNSDTTGTSALRLGATIDLQYFGGAFALQQVMLSPYFQTDFQGKAKIYGFSASWSPFDPERHLNGRFGDRELGGFDFKLGADIDFGKVNTAGNSGLVTGTEYGWIGASAGLSHTFAKANNIRLGASVSAGYDVISDNDAILFGVSLALPIVEDQTFLEIKYENGKRRSDLKGMDLLTAGLRVKF